MVRSNDFSYRSILHCFADDCIGVHLAHYHNVSVSTSGLDRKRACLVCVDCVFHIDDFCKHVILFWFGFVQIFGFCWFCCVGFYLCQSYFLPLCLHVVLLHFSCIWVVNPLVLITVPQLDHKLLDTTPRTYRSQNAQKVSSTPKKIAISVALLYSTHGI